VWTVKAVLSDQKKSKQPRPKTPEEVYINLQVQPNVASDKNKSRHSSKSGKGKGRSKGAVMVSAKFGSSNDKDLAKKMRQAFLDSRPEVEVDDYTQMWITPDGEVLTNEEFIKSSWDQ